jgi:hypothetical protein
MQSILLSVLTASLDDKRGRIVLTQEDPCLEPGLSVINGRGKDRSPNGLGDSFDDLWFNDLVQAQAIRALFLIESNTGFDLSVLSYFSRLMRAYKDELFIRLLCCLLE